MLEVARDVVTAVEPHLYRARLRLRTKPGARVTRIDLYRTRVEEASLNLDTMGPPIARITGPDAQWAVTGVSGTGAGETQPMGIITGFDQPEGSWKRVFYRAVAWSADDVPRGLYGGRSLPSAAMEVIVPPATPPDLAPIVSSWPGGPLGDVLFTTSASAPVGTTPLGPHRIKLEVLAVKPDGTLSPLYSYPSAGQDNSLAAIPAVAGPGLWREPLPGGGTRYCIRVSKPAIEDAARIRILLTDPLGRSAEQVLEAPAGSPLPAPDIVDPMLSRVPGKGFIFAFKTHVPVQAVPFGPYLLQVRLTPAAPFSPAPPGRPVTSALALPDIRLLQPMSDPFMEFERPSHAAQRNGRRRDDARRLFARARQGYGDADWP